MTMQDTELAQRPSSDMAQRTDVMLRVASPVDIYENQDEYVIVADFPGVSSEAVSVQLEGSELVIEGAQSSGEQHGGEHPPLLFRRSFRVPELIDADTVRAELKHGVLSVHLTKAQAAKPRRIEVRAG